MTQVPHITRKSTDNDRVVSRPRRHACLGFDVDGDGFAIGGSFEGGESWHVFGGYGSTNFDFGVDLNELVIGAGYHTAISDTVDFVGELAYVSVEVEVPAGFTVDDDGIGVSIGLRGMMSDVVELSGSINYVDPVGDGETSFDANAWFNMSPASELFFKKRSDPSITGWQRS